MITIRADEISNIIQERIEQVKDIIELHVEVVPYISKCQTILSLLKS